MKTYYLYIKSHCEYPDFEEQYRAKNKKDAVEMAYKDLRGEFDKEFISKNMAKIK